VPGLADAARQAEAELDPLARAQALVKVRDREVTRLKTANGRLQGEVDDLGRLLDRYSTIKAKTCARPSG